MHVEEPHKKQLSVVVPVYNSSATLQRLVSRLHMSLSDICANAYEIILVNDGSRDGSWAEIEALARKSNLSQLNTEREQSAGEADSREDAAVVAGASSHNAFRAGATGSVGAGYDASDDGRSEASDASPLDASSTIESSFTERRLGRVVGIDLARNFGQHNAILCGLAHSQGAMVVTIDDDQQVPPEEISKLWAVAQGPDQPDLVYGVYGRKKHARWRNVGSFLVRQLYARIFNRPPQLTSFRLIRRSVVQALLSYDKSFVFIDGLLAWHAGDTAYVEVEHHARQDGHSGYSLRRLMALAFTMLTTFSIMPLQLATVGGVLLAVFSFSVGTYFLFKKIFWGIPVAGFTSIIVALMFFSGVQLLTLGILGEYIGRLHLNLNRRPPFVVRRLTEEKAGHESNQC